MKNTFFILSICFLFVSCKNNWQRVDYNGVSAVIPVDWGSKNIVNYNHHNNVTEYQISCWSAEDNSSLTIQWMDTTFQNDLYIDSMIERQILQFSLFNNFKYSEITDTMYLNLQAKKCHLNKYIGYNNEIKGEYIAFTVNKISYIVIIIGSNKFYKSDAYIKILQSIKPIFSGRHLLQEERVQDTQVANNFTLYEFREYSFEVPNTMELRNKNSRLALGKEILRDKLKHITKIDIGDYQFVFQPEGLSDVQNKERHKQATDLYSRILVQYQKGNKDDFINWNENPFSITQEEYNQINTTYKNNLLEGAEQIKQSNTITFKLLEIEDIEISKNAKGYFYIKQSYTRMGLNGDVKISDCYFFNNNEMLKLTLSYRISESNLWEEDFGKILDTFSFNIKYD